MPPQFPNPMLPEDPPTHTHARLIFFAITLFLIGILAVGFFVNRNRAEIANLESQSLPLVATSTPFSEMFDWKTYRNEQYGFEFKYPSSMIITVERENMIAFSLPETDKLIKEKKSLRVGDVIVFMDKNPENLPAEVFYNRPDSFFLNPEVVTVNDITMLKITKCGISEEMSCASIPSNSVFIEFTNFLNYEILDEILSTFKFISTSTKSISNQAVPKNIPDDWKIYTNDLYGFSLKYPKSWELNPTTLGLLSIGKQFKNSTKPENVCQIDVSTDFRESGESLRSWQARVDKQFVNREIVDVTLNGKAGIKFDLETGFYTFIPIDTKEVLVISLSCPLNLVPQILTESNQILSTFKFIK